jgi:hypothetical protein
MDWSTGGAQATLRRGVLWQLVEKLRLVVSAPGTSFPRRRESSDYLKHRPWNRTCAGMAIDFQRAAKAKRWVRVAGTRSSSSGQGWLYFFGPVCEQHRRTGRPMEVGPVVWNPQIALRAGIVLLVLFCH